MSRIDRRRKLPVTTLLYALGIDGETATGGNPQHLLQAGPYIARPRTAGACRSIPTGCAAIKLLEPLVDADTGEVVLEAGKKLTVRRRAQARREGHSRRCGRPTRICSAATSPRTWSTIRRPAKSTPRPARNHREPRSPRWRSRASSRLQAAGARHRPRQCRPYIRNTLAVDKKHDARGRADRHLPRHAPGRAADAGHRRGAVPRRCSSIPSATTCRRSAA
jgi:hypothetical protein